MTGSIGAGAGGDNMAGVGLIGGVEELLSDGFESVSSFVGSSIVK
jgi:hypothetical protein